MLVTDLWKLPFVTEYLTNVGACAFRRSPALHEGSMGNGFVYGHSYFAMIELKCARHGSTGAALNKAAVTNFCPLLLSSSWSYNTEMVPAH